MISVIHCLWLYAERVVRLCVVVQLKKNQPVTVMCPQSSRFQPSLAINGFVID